MNEVECRVTDKAALATAQEFGYEPSFEGMREVGGNATPRMGEVLVRYMAVAYLEGGDVKRAICNALVQDGGAAAARAIMRKKAHAARDYSAIVPRMIAEDLASGMSYADVDAKWYRYIYERWFYADPNVVPKDDKHWSVMPLAVCPRDTPEDEADERAAHHIPKNEAESIFDTSCAGFGPAPCGTDN